MEAIRQKMLAELPPVMAKCRASRLVIELEEGELITELSELSDLIRNTRRMMSPVWPTEITLVDKTGKQEEILWNLIKSRMPNYAMEDIMLEGLIIKTAIE